MTGTHRFRLNFHLELSQADSLGRQLVVANILELRPICSASGVIVSADETPCWLDLCSLGRHLVPWTERTHTTEVLCRSFVYSWYGVVPGRFQVFCTVDRRRSFAAIWISAQLMRGYCMGLRDSGFRLSTHRLLPGLFCFVHGGISGN